MREICSARAQKWPLFGRFTGRWRWSESQREWTKLNRRNFSWNIRYFLVCYLPMMPAAEDVTAERWNSWWNFSVWWYFLMHRFSRLNLQHGISLSVEFVSLDTINLQYWITELFLIIANWYYRMNKCVSSTLEKKGILRGKLKKYDSSH